MSLNSSTICALASGNNQAGVAVIRLSGKESFKIAEGLCPSNQPLKHQQIHHRWLVNPNQPNEIVDEVLVLAFKAPKSFTGEDCIEIHCHGGLKLTELILNYCIELGTNPAEPGEFSKRAVLNGKMSLAQAESVLDLIHAENETLIKAAAQNLKYQTIQKWVSQFSQKLAHTQATMVASIDFPDEVDEPDRIEIIDELTIYLDELKTQIEAAEKTQILRDGFQIALLGKPNAGKSSIFNALLNSERAIVTDIAGTTRDVISEKIVLESTPITLFDTAGLRDKTEDQIEKMGIERAEKTAKNANLILYVIDGTQPIDSKDIDEIRNYQKHVKNGIILINKLDAKEYRQNLRQELNTQGLAWGILELSTLNQKLIIELLKNITPFIQQNTAHTQPEFILSKRQLGLLHQTLINLEQAQNTLKQANVPLDLITVYFTDALNTLAQLTGFDLTETVLDSVFSRFCVGK